MLKIANISAEQLLEIVSHGKTSEETRIEPEDGFK